MPILNWIGKDKVVGHHLNVPFYTLEHKYGFRADDEKDQSETHSGNIIIHGDNLVALKALLPEFEGRVNCAYFDPPYNTGEEKWVYNDNVNDPHIKKWLGEVVGKEGEDLSRHDKWLCMMYPRLVMVHKLLHSEGVAFISIDDNEYTNLKAICDEIFGKSCFVAKITWQNNYSKRNDAKGIPYDTDNILVYSKEPNWMPNKLERTDEMNARYVNYDNDFLSYKVTPIHAPGANTHKGMVYAIQHPLTGELMYPPKGRHWKDGQDNLMEELQKWCPYEKRIIDDRHKREDICGDYVEEDVYALMLRESKETSARIFKERYESRPWPKYFFLSNGEGSIQSKTYLDVTKGKVVSTLWKYEDVGTNVEATNELKEIFDNGKKFDTPKPTRLIERILDIATDENSIVLDCFAGSGTTAHAVLLANKKRHSNMKFILIELMDYADTTTAYRVKRAITGYPAKMKHEEEIYNKKLTIKNLPQSEMFLKEAEAVIEREKNNYSEIGKPKLVDNSIKVIATRVSDGFVEGLGGSFDFYELGKPLFVDGQLNEEVEEEKIRQFIYYSETRQPLHRERKTESKYLLDTWQRTGYYFYYEIGKSTELTIDTLSIVTEKADQYIIYADVCRLPKDFMSEKHIIFKKIPRDIKRF
jgi:adenine-specific DNA-methyltransferase